MSIFVTLLTVISVIYGLMWFVFVFVEPPGRLNYYFRTPTMLYFLPGERAGRLAMAIICGGVIPFLATMIVQMFMYV